MKIKNADLPFPGVMYRNQDEFASEEAQPGLIESAAEQEVGTQVDAEQQAKLLAEQEAGAESAVTKQNAEDAPNNDVPEADSKES